MSKELTKSKLDITKMTEMNVGFDYEDSQDLKISRTKIMQALSPELQDIDTLKQGDVINSITKDKLPEEFIPLFFFKSYIRFNARTQKDHGYDSNYGPGAIIWRANSIAQKPTVEQLKQLAWDGDTKPLAQTIYNFVSWFPDYSEEPIFLSMQGTSYKFGVMFYNEMKRKLHEINGKQVTEPPFFNKYKFVIEDQETDGNKYKIMKIKFVEPTTEDQRLKAFEMYQNYKPLVEDAAKQGNTETSVEQETKQTPDKPSWEQ